ncbi:CoxG family protein [Bradyrhizobium neotropicale]|uniref:CoxG family protein n=1 Tax=Bradyrhizobium neotropicale TaxID=1497615 RepID=UPI001AD6FD84|nr:carbon monoxide dehydrogenase subunit G [Bradyrhizobium neotropicale]MBO4226841.1 carbon monoxide dehydrogenase [Bradyrhizobium neotropicale]
MIVKGERFVAADPDVVWRLALDPATLKACIPGCEDLERMDGQTYRASMVAKVGPVKARFSGQVVIDAGELPHACRLAGEGSGGIAGFARGSALIHVDRDEGGSRLTYEAVVEIGGKMASLGERLFRSVVQRNINDFFDALAKQVLEYGTDSVSE